MSFPPQMNAFTMRYETALGLTRKSEDPAARCVGQHSPVGSKLLGTLDLCKLLPCCEKMTFGSRSSVQGYEDRSGTAPARMFQRALHPVGVRFPSCV